MLFHSFAYVTLLVATLLVCGCLPANRRWPVLLLASGIFYLAWRIEYLLLLVLTAVSCHFAALGLECCSRRASRKVILASVVSLNLGILFVFKYYGLFAATARQLVGIPLVDDLGFLLPVGISFYTFQAIGYVVDVYQGRLAAERSLARTSLFISFFPQLVAGPIERASRLLPALAQPIHFRWRNIRSGAWLFLWGLFKKVVIADRLSWLVDAAYSEPTSSAGWLLLIATYAFALQIYCDFSGYTDMAIGSAKFFGIDLMPNFRLPYAATSLRDFWGRWHISLSTWFRDYIYLPLGGRRVSALRWSLNVLFVFAISGLWHGAQWTFVVWGILHGFALLVEAKVANRLPAPSNVLVKRFKKCIQWFITFHVVLLAWIFFRADALQDAGAILQQISTNFDLHSIGMPESFSRLEFTVLGVSLIWMFGIETWSRGNPKRVLGIRPRIACRILVITTLLLTLNFGIFSNPTQFVYFQF